MRLLLALALLLAGCKVRGADTPDQAYRVFVDQVRALHEGKDPKDLLQRFDAPTRAALMERARAMDPRHPPTEDDVPRMLAWAGAAAPEVAKVETAQQTGDRATVHVTLDGGAASDVEMVREDGAWRVHVELPK